MSLIYGVGINDLAKEAGSPAYVRWRSILKRCYGPDRPEYAAYGRDSVCEEWLTFSKFKKWLASQPWNDMQIDKDILVKGNTIYSPDTCCLIDSKLNMLLMLPFKGRGPYPIGVQLGRWGKYEARCTSFHGGRKHIGSFSSPLSAHLAWQKYKASQIEGAVTYYAEKDYFRSDVAQSLIARAWSLRSSASKGVEIYAL